jgi:hypothetical protein
MSCFRNGQVATVAPNGLKELRQALLEALAAYPAFQRFKRIVLEDFEFQVLPGERPRVVCGQFYELLSGQSWQLWRDTPDQSGDQPPYLIDDETLVICFVANAEMSCHLALDDGWAVPKHVLDLSPVFKCLVNGRGIPRKQQSLLGALKYFELDTMAPAIKDSMRDRIMKGWPFTAEEREKILRYCEQDVAALLALLLKLLAHIDLPIALHWGEAVAALARSQHVGPPIDPLYWELKASWAELRDNLVPALDPGVYVRDRRGAWHFSAERFEDYLRAINIAWPRNEENGRLNLQRSTFDAMAKAWPEHFETLRQLRYIRDQLRSIELAVGADNRNRTVLWAFSSKTSRTQPKAREWIFSPSVWLRFLIKPEPGRAIAYVDFSGMEFGAAAALSDGHIGPNNPMMELYQSGDPYLGFGKRVNFVDVNAARDMPGIEAKRGRLKIGSLSAQYGIHARTLALRMGTSEIEAHEMLLRHRGLMTQYWAWSDDWLQHALNTGEMRTRMGWRCVTGISELSTNSIRNWPIQANCADVFRLAYVWATRHGLTLIAPVHDAVLLEAAEGQIEADVALMQEIMTRSSRVVLGFELRTDAKIVKHPDRYTDGRGKEIWTMVLKLLDERRRQQEEVNNARLELRATEGIL